MLPCSQSGDADLNPTKLWPAPEKGESGVAPVTSRSEDAPIFLIPDWLFPAGGEHGARRCRFSSVTELSRQVRSKEVSPVELTELYLVLSQALTDIEKLGVRLEPIPLPDYPYQEVFQMVRGAEASVFHEDLILEDHLATLSDDAPRSWKNLLPMARLTPAVLYLKAQQIRTLMQADANRILQEVNVWITPAGGPARLVERPRSEPPAACLGAQLR